MSNMLYCCSVYVKTDLPMIIILNKSDIGDCKKIISWINDFDIFNEEVKLSNKYLSSFSRSLGLALEDFYKQINIVEIDSLSGNGIEDLIIKLNK